MTVTSMPPGTAGPPAENKPSPVAYLPLDLVHPHPDNLRSAIGDVTETAESMKAHGVLEPLLAEPDPDQPGHVRVLAGHRRLAAAAMAGLDGVPVIIRESGRDEPEALMLIENCHREGLPAMDKAEGMERLIKKGYTPAQIAEMTGFSSPTVYSYLALLDLDDSSRDLVRSGRLSAADALAGVREVRKKQRKKEGKGDPSPVWEPDHFTRDHPLAFAAASLCDQEEHTLRRRVGKVACGRCWESVIRADERGAPAGTVSSA